MDNATSASTRRTALFGDPKSSINLWGFFVRESLLLLGHDYQTFLRRGKPVPTPVAPPLPKPKIEFDPKIVTPAPLIRQRVFKATADSPGLAALDALASDGPIAKVVDAGADATHVPELFRSVEKQVLASPAGEEGKKIKDNALGLSSRLNAQLASLLHRLVSNVPDPLKETFGRLVRWWSKERLSKVVEASLPFRELDVIVLDGRLPYLHLYLVSILFFFPSIVAPGICVFDGRSIRHRPTRYPQNSGGDGIVPHRNRRIPERNQCAR
jgi:nucleoporin NDC1